MSQMRAYCSGRCVMAAALTMVAACAIPCFAAENFYQTESQRLNSQEIRDTARNVMESNDFRSVHRSFERSDAEEDESSGFLQKIFDAITDFLERLLGNLGESSAPSASTAIGLSQIVMALAIIAMIVVVVLIVAAIVRSVDARQAARRAAQLDPEGEATLSVTAPPGEMPAQLYAERALEFAAKGDYRRAIRELLLGGMSWIERAGQIRFRRGLTNRDYVRAIWRQSNRRDAFLNIALDFERVFFGRREATEEMFRGCLEHFQREFREIATTTQS